MADVEEFRAQKCVEKNLKKNLVGNFAGSLVVRTLCFYSRGHGFKLWLGN